jgi:hypothetical protein
MWLNSYNLYARTMSIAQLERAFIRDYRMKMEGKICLCLFIPQINNGKTIIILL